MYQQLHPACNAKQFCACSMVLCSYLCHSLVDNCHAATALPIKAKAAQCTKHTLRSVQVVPNAGKAEQGSSSSAGQDSSQPSSGAKQVTSEGYPHQVQDPLKVQLELRHVKEAALQTVTELYRGLLYVILSRCHA